MYDLRLRVEQDPRIHGVSIRQINAIINEYKPKEWTRPGKKKRRLPTR